MNASKRPTIATLATTAFEYTLRLPFSRAVVARTMGWVFTLALLLGVSAAPARATTWYVAPNGSSSNSGLSDAAPWDLDTAFKIGNTVQPGDTVLMLSGTYAKAVGVGNPGFECYLTGTSESARITVKPAPGATPIIQIDSLEGQDNACISIMRPYVDFIGLQFNNNAQQRGYIMGDSYMEDRPKAIRVMSDHARLINLTIHNMTGSSIGSFDNVGTNLEIYGCVIFNNAITKFGHGIYANGHGPKTLRNNIVFNNASNGITLHRKRGELANTYYEVDGNTIFGNGVVYGDGARNFDTDLNANVSVHVHDNFLQQSVRPKDAQLGWPESTVGKGDATHPSDNLYSADVTFQRNYLTAALKLTNDCPGGTISNNIMYQDPAVAVGFKKFILPNKYQRGRANVTVYNWNGTTVLDLSPSDLGASGANLEAGHEYEIRDVQNFLGQALTIVGTSSQTFTYDGTSTVRVTIPGSGDTVAPYVAGVRLSKDGVLLESNFTPPVQHTDNKFACLVILPVSGSSPDPDPVPEAPRYLQALRDVINPTGQINLTWSHDSEDETGFTIDRKVGTGSYSTLVANKPAYSTSHDDATVSPGTTYTYRVLAYNATGSSAWSNEAIETTAPAGGNTTVFDANSLTIVATSSGDTTTTVADATATNGNFLRLNSNAANDFITLNVSVPTTGMYTVKVSVHKNAYRGVCQLAVDNGSGFVDFGAEQDLYAATAAIVQLNLGSVALTSGTRPFRFTVKSKNAASADFQLAFDKIEIALIEDSTAPLVSLSNPATDTTVSGSTVPVLATASDNVGVVGVQFKVDGNNIGTEDMTFPYGVDWDSSSVADGAHVLTAVARDAAGNSTVSSSVSVNVDNTAPTVSITAPTNYGTVSGSVVTVSAAASDAVSLSGVQFWVDGVELGDPVVTGPYSVVWDTTPLTNGSHTLTATAWDEVGNLTTSSVVTVTVSNNNYYGTPLESDANGLTIVAASDATTAVTNVDATGGNFLRLDANAINDYITFNVSVPTTQPYKVEVKVHKNAFRGIFQLAIDNGSGFVNVGSATDIYVPSPQFETIDFGAVALTAGTRQFRFTVTGKNATSGDFQLAFDTITITPIIGDTTAPTVSITGPTGGSTVSGTAVTVLATASDNVGVVGVQFKLDGVNLGGEVITAPFSKVWDSTTASNGSHSLTAVARDMAGNSTVSSATTVTVANAAVVYDANSLPIAASSGDGTTTLTVSGANNGNYLRYDSNGVNDYVTFTVNVAAAGNYNVSVKYRKFTALAIAQLEIDGTNLGAATDLYSTTDIFATAELGQVTLASGNRAFKFKVTGKNTSSTGYRVSIDIITLTPAGGDTTAPTVSLTAPTGGQSVSGTAVTVSANASDNIGVAGVQFMLDGNTLGSEDTSSPYSATWDTTTATAGSHTLTAVARDAAGNTTTSSVVTVTVDNAPVVYDVNNLTIAASSGDPAVNATSPDATGGSFIRYEANAVNDYITFTVNVAQTRTYNVWVRYRKNKVFGICQLDIDGTNRGAAQDLYNTDVVYASIDLGQVSLAAGNRAFKFKVTGKNSSSSDYQFTIDTLTLAPVL